MNIHFGNRELYCDLLDVSVASIKVGSHMYGLDNENSDEDLLHIYIEPTINKNSFMWEHHQLQYKHKGVDHNFTTLQAFIRNAMTGDATINFETLFSEELKLSPLKWLWRHRESFINYNIIKSYLGMAKRDLKMYLKDSNRGTVNTVETDKKLSHFYRGLIYAEMLLEGEFSLKLEGKHHVMAKGYMDDFTFLKNVKSGEWSKDRDTNMDFLKEAEDKMENLRKKLNARLDARKIVKFMNPENMQSLDYDTRMFTKGVNNGLKTLDYGDLFYKALEEGITY